MIVTALLLTGDTLLSAGWDARLVFWVGRIKQSCQRDLRVPLLAFSQLGIYKALNKEKAIEARRGLLRAL